MVLDPGFVFVEKLRDAVALVAEEGIVGEAVDLVADDEGDEAVAHDGGDGRGFVGGACGAATGEVEAVEEAPVDGVEKAAEVLESAAGEHAVLVLLDDGIDEGPLPVVLDAVADAADLFGVVEADAFPWSDVAEVAAETENAGGIEIAEGADEGLVATARRIRGCRAGRFRS